MNRLPYPARATAAGAPIPAATRFCGHCGKASDGGASPPSNVHGSCGDDLAMEPPRYCTACGRRMKVQVTPLGWSAECSRHGLSAP